MFTLNEFKTRIDEARDFLEEKLIVYNGGKKYGQVVFLAGGAGSGKGFAIGQFMESEKFKIRDVDEMKKAYLALDKLTGKFPEIRGLDLKIPEDVAALHAFVKEKGIKDRTLTLLLANKDPKRLPNIIFDITAKGMSDITKVVPLLMQSGYSARDIHLTWVLTDYKVAATANKERDRVVPEDILMGTHVGAANTMTGIMLKNKLPRSVLDGGVYVVLNNRENTVVWTDQDKASNAKQSRERQNTANEKDAKGVKRGAMQNGKLPDFKFSVKSFSYMVMKKPGKPMNSSKDLQDQLSTWVNANAPKDWAE